ncbi:ATPase domain-containing protein [Alienimonas chondri]|nr:ATPase domain-containing protein [Alienimonas chondri]
MRRVPTGVPGLDPILNGGLPDRSLCVIAGRPGTGKTVLTHQTLFHTLGSDDRALYLTTLAEPSVKMVRYMQTFDFYEPDRVGTQLIYRNIGETLRTGGFDAALEQVAALIKEHQPRFVVIDSFKIIDRIVPESGGGGIREFSYRLAVQLAAWDVTGFLVGEYTEDDITNDGVFTIADGIVHLYVKRQSMYTQRYLEVMKFRGTEFFAGQHPYEITSDGITVSARVNARMTHSDMRTGQRRVSSGVGALDEMLHGGLQEGTAAMLAGGSGTGKTLIGLQFIVAAAARGERSVIAGFQENPNHLEQVAAGFGWDLAGLKRKGLLEHLYRSPVEIQPDRHFHAIREAIDRGDTKLLLVDSMKDIEAGTADADRYRDFLYSMVMAIKGKGVTLLLTNEIPELFGPFQFSEYGISFITDAILVLRYVELGGSMTRALSVMKLRGSRHSKEIREFEINDEGLHLLDPITAYTGVMTGVPTGTDSPTLRHLPESARAVIGTLKRIGPADAAAVAAGVNADPATVQAELSLLEQQGLVLKISRDGNSVYRPTV